MKYPKEAPIFFDKWRREIVEAVDVIDDGIMSGLLQIRHMEDCVTCFSGVGFGFLAPNHAEPLTPTAEAMLAIAVEARR